MAEAVRNCVPGFPALKLVLPKTKASFWLHSWHTCLCRYEGAVEYPVTAQRLATPRDSGQGLHPFLTSLPGTSTLTVICHSLSISAFREQELTPCTSQPWLPVKVTPACFAISRGCHSGTFKFGVLRKYSGVTARPVTLKASVNVHCPHIPSYSLSC